jgi:hypothetical protein
VTKYSVFRLATTVILARDARLYSTPEEDVSRPDDPIDLRIVFIGLVELKISQYKTLHTLMQCEILSPMKITVCTE